MIESLRGLRAVVTGGESGIGVRHGVHAGGGGAHVTCIDLDVTRVPAGLHGVTGDVADAGLAGVIDAVAAPGLDLLISDAGVLARGRVEDNDLSEWQRVFDVNVFGMVRAAQAALPWLRRSSRAAIVNMCSLSAQVGLANAALYSASKGAVLALTRSMATDYLPEGIRVNCVMPGPTDTPWVRRVIDAAPDRGRLPERRREPLAAWAAGTPDEVAAAICFLASPAAGSIAGVALPVDGGAAAILSTLSSSLPATESSGY